MKNMKFSFVAALVLTFSLQSHAALNLEFSFSPFIEEPSVNNVHLIASASNLAYYNYSSLNYSVPSALIYRFEDGGLVQEANLFYLLPTRSCSLSQFQMVENQAVLICQADNQSQINIFTRLNQQWTLEQTILYKAAVFGLQDSRPNRFVVKTNEGFAFIEKNEAQTWQLQNINLQFEKASGYFKKLIWLGDNKALVQRSVGPVDEFDLIVKPSSSSNGWTVSPMALPANIKLGYYGSAAAYQNGTLVFSDVTGSAPNPTVLKLEIFNLDSQSRLSHLQTLNVGPVTNASSPQVVLEDGFIFVSRPFESGLSSFDMSGRIEIYKFSDNQKLFEKFDTLYPLVTGQPGQAMFGYQLVSNQNYLFATLSNQPSATQNGVLSTFVNGYALPSVK